MRIAIGLLCLGVLAGGCAHGGKATGRRPEERRTREFIVAHLAEEGVTEGLDTVLYERVRERIMAMPYLAVYDAGERLVLQTLGYRPDLTTLLDATFAGRELMPVSDRKMLPLKNLDGSWFDPRKLPPARYTIYEFWASWCEPCRMQMRALQEYLAASPARESIRVVRVLCEPFAFEKKPVPDLSPH